MTPSQHSLRNPCTRDPSPVSSAEYEALLFKRDRQQRALCLLVCRIHMLTNTQEVNTHSVVPSKCTHSSNPKSHMDKTCKTSQMYRQHKQELYCNPCPSLGTHMPARNPVPLDFISIPRHTWYMKKFPLHRLMLSSRKEPARKDARLTPPRLAASSPSACRSFIAGWPKRP
jgi:hypothetical protein